MMQYGTGNQVPTGPPGLDTPASRRASSNRQRLVNGRHLVARVTTACRSSSSVKSSVSSCRKPLLLSTLVYLYLLLTALALVPCVTSGNGAGLQAAGVEPAARALMDRISADSLRGHLSFIASDMLEGRDTPSRGLDLAAEYIAAQFRRAGLEPAGGDGFFQIANWPVASQNSAGFKLELDNKGATLIVVPPQCRWSTETELDLSRLPLVKLGYQDAAAESLSPNSLSGKALITETPDFDGLSGADRPAAFRAWFNFLNKVRASGPAALIAIGRSVPDGPPRVRLLNPQGGPPSQSRLLRPLLTIYDAHIVALYDVTKAGEVLGLVSLHLSPDVNSTAKLRNVIGLLRGSDPTLNDTYVLVTAHYDHLGMKETGTGDRIYNGANDDGSGTVSVVELALAFARLNPRPKRSIAFMTFFGEEKGLLGSRYYGSHPLFPVASTIADINLEQVGRTDDDEGPQLGTATMTGLDYSDIGQIFQAAGEALGIKVYKHPRNSDAYFSRSDNQSLADQGVPAHTLGVAFSYPDYHGVGDHWDKIDYMNMERVDQLVALGIYRIAQNPVAPRWNASNPKAAKYLDAWKKIHPQ
jgi:hypothetical protein